MRQIGAKVALSCATWRQDGPKMANLRAFLEASRQLFEILDAKPQIAKTFEKPLVFLKVFQGFLMIWRVSGAVLADLEASWDLF